MERRRRRPVLLMVVAFGLLLVLASALSIYAIFRDQEPDINPVTPTTIPNADITTDIIIRQPAVDFTEDLPLAIKTRLLTALSDAKPQTIVLAIVAFLICLILIMVIVKVASSASSYNIADQSGGKLIEYKSFEIDTPTIISSVIVAIVMIFLLFVAGQSVGDGKLFKMDSKKGAFQVKVIHHSDFTASFKHGLRSRLSSGQTMTDFLRSAFMKNSSTLANILDDSTSQQDFCALVSKYLDIVTFECSTDDSHLETNHPVCKDFYPNEIPNIEVDHPASEGSLEIAFTERAFSPISTFAPAINDFVHAVLSDFHFFLSDRGKFVVVVKGEEERMAMIVAMVAFRFRLAGCSISKSGRTIIEKIQSAVEVFTNGTCNNVQFCIVRQQKEDGDNFVDVLQAGVLAVAVKSKQSQQISASTGFAPSSMTDPKYYRMTAKSGDTVLMYNNTVAYNVLPSIMATHSRAASLAAIVSAMFAHATNVIHIPYPAENQPCSPIIPPTGEEILAISRMID